MKGEGSGGENTEKMRKKKREIFDEKSESMKARRGVDVASASAWRRRGVGVASARRRFSSQS